MFTIREIRATSEWHWEPVIMNPMDPQDCTVCSKTVEDHGWICSLIHPPTEIVKPEYVCDKCATNLLGITTGSGASECPKLKVFWNEKT